MDQDGTWHVGRPRPGHVVLDGHPAPLPKKGAPSPHFLPVSVVANGWMDQDATC